MVAIFPCANNTAVVKSWARMVASSERRCRPMNVTRAMATMATATSTSNNVKPAARVWAWGLTRFLFHILIEDLHPARQGLNHQSGLLIAVRTEMNDAWLREPGWMKMRHRISLACFRALGRDHIQNADVYRQGIGAQFPACFWPTHIAIEVAHRYHLPVEVKCQAVDTFRQ